MTAHKHANLMLQYAQDAMETDKPWERWEVEAPNEWKGCEISPSWSEDHNYRRKPQTIKVTVNGKDMEFPKLLTTKVIEGDFIYVLDKSNPAETPPFRVIPLRFQSNDFLSCWYLKNGLMHHTKEAAQAHADVLNAICRGDIE
jgi:hypothetical protein